MVDHEQPQIHLEIPKVYLEARNASYESERRSRHEAQRHLKLASASFAVEETKRLK